MRRYTVRQGKRYRAEIVLGIFRSVASNETVAARFRDIGFAEVEIAGSGRRRVGTGLWPLADATAEVPDEIVAVEEIEV